MSACRCGGTGSVGVSWKVGKSRIVKLLTQEKKELRKKLDVEGCDLYVSFC